MRRSLRYYYLKLVRQRGTPETVALGVVVGVFVGVATPPFPFLHMLIAFAIAWVLGCSRAAAVLGVWVCNPVTIPVILALQMSIGRRVVGLPRTTMSIEALMKFLTDIPAHGNVLLAWCIGALITGVVSTVLSFFAAKYAIQVYRRRKADHRTRKIGAEAALADGAAAE